MLKKVSQGKKTDLLMILPFRHVFPSGGFNIVYELSRRAKNDGQSVQILFIKNMRKVLFNITKDPITLLYKREFGIKYILFTYLINNNSFGPKMIKLVRRFLKINYDENIENIQTFYGNSLRKVPKAHNIVATAWETAFLLQNAKVDSNKYYLIQNDEDNESFSGKMSPLVKQTYKFSLKKIVISDKLERKFAQIGSLRMQIGINQNIFKLTNPVNNRRGNRLVVPVRTGEFKGSLLAIALIKELIKMDVEIHTFGNSRVPVYAKNLKNHGVINDQQLAAIYNDSDIFVLTSVIEGVPSPPLEAMSCGMAVISTNNGGINEYIRNGINGIITERNDLESLMQSIKLLLTDYDYRVALGKESQKVAGYYSYEKMYESFKKCLDYK